MSVAIYTNISLMHRLTIGLIFQVLALNATRDQISIV